MSIIHVHDEQRLAPLLQFYRRAPKLLKKLMLAKIGVRTHTVWQRGVQTGQLL